MGFLWFAMPSSGRVTRQAAQKQFHSQVLSQLSLFHAHGGAVMTEPLDQANVIAVPGSSSELISESQVQLWVLGESVTAHLMGSIWPWGCCGQSLASVVLPATPAPIGVYMEMSRPGGIVMDGSSSGAVNPPVHQGWCGQGSFCR